MATRKVYSSRLTLPGKQLLHRSAVLMLIVCGATLLVMSKTNNPGVLRLRTAVTDMVAPVLAFAASPMSAVHNAGLWVGDMMHIRSDNIALKNQNIELLKWQAAAKEMQSENESLRKLLHVVPAKKASYVTARVVSDLSGPYVHSALINGGEENGIAKDSAAITSDGLIGRVVDVGQTSARILLLGDINSRVPVLVERTREKSILAGTNSALPTLSYLAANTKIQTGDRVVTSGDGGIFPAGIPVGIVSDVRAGSVTVQPYTDATGIEYVSVVNYGF